MKIYNIKSTTSDNYYTKTQSYTSFKAIPKNLVTDTFEKITNPKNKSVYEKLVETFKDHKPEIGFGWCTDTKQAIENAYKSILDANGEVNDYAFSTLFKLCYMEPDFSNPFTPFVNMINKIVRAKTYNHRSMINWEDKILDKTERCQTYREEGLGQIAKILEVCKDKNGNHNKTNLDFANWIEKNCTIIKSNVLEFINLCKDLETGVCTDENIQLFKELYKKDRHLWFKDIVNEDGIVTEDALKFFNDSENIIASKQKTDSRDDRDFCRTYRTIMKDALQHSRGKDRDEILKLIFENRDLLVKNSDRYDSDSILNYAADKMDTNGKYTINLTNLKRIIEKLKDSELKDFWFRNLSLLKDENGIINNKNEACIELLVDGIEWSFNGLNNIMKFKEAKDKNGNINEDFCQKFAEIAKKYNKTTHKRKEPWGQILVNCMEYMQNKDKTVNWEATKIVYPLLQADYIDRGFICESSDNETTNKFLTTLSMMMRDENGDFYDEGINKVKKLAEKYKDAEKLAANEILAYIDLCENLEKAKDMNLYKADDMYGLLDEIQSKGKLTAEYFSTPIDENGNTLLMYIADIPQDMKNHKYRQIIEILQSTRDIDFEQQDKFGISFLEKVINSENTELLDLIKYRKIKYNPMLDYAFDGIQNQEFKKEAQKVELSFPELVEAVYLNSTEAFEKVKSQLNSPFCNDNIKEKLHKMAQGNKNFTILASLKNSMD